MNVNENQKIVVNTPLGDIVVTVKGTLDPDSYPGIFIDLKGSNLNDTFEKETVGLAWIEYDHTKNAIQTIVYGDGNKNEYTHLVVHEHVAKEAETNALC